MTSRDPYAFAHALPAGALAVGPTGWPRAGAEPARGSLDGLSAEPPGDEPGLLLLHGGHLGAEGDPAALAPILRALRRARPDLLPVLLYRDLDAEGCCALFRAGLFDALRAPVAAAAWERTLARCERRREAQRRESALRAERDETARRLHAHRRRLQEQVAEVDEDLLRAQRELEAANGKLTQHMSQISLLYQFGRELSTARNWDATLRGLLEHLSEFLGAAGAALVLRSASGGTCAPRQTYRWDEQAWDRVILRLERQLGEDLAGGLLAPGVYHLGAEPDAEERGRGLTALPLEHQGVHFGYLLLLDRPGAGAEARAGQLQFLQAVQIILAEEVAAAQMLDRMREIGTFNARVLETVRSGIWVVDATGRTVYSNRAGRRLLTGRDPASAESWEPDLAVGRGRAAPASFGPHVAGADGQGYPELFLDGLLRLDDVDGPPLARLLAAAEGTFQGEGRLRRPDGEAVPIMVVTSTMPGRGRGERWLVVVAEDLREAKKLEAERSRADRLESLVEMSATLAHEIRNPLTGLSAQAELLADRLPAGDRRQRYIEVITGEVERINATINRLLNFVRPYEPQLGEADPAALAEDCLELVRARAAERGIALASVQEPAGAGPESRRQVLDPDQIKQVLLNLLLNAVDAAPAGGRVELRLRSGAGIELRDGLRGTSQLTSGTVIEVRDDGPGFAEPDVERLFRPFYTTKSSGTGLGLAICRKIVNAHGGEIRAVREVGHTVFRVLLPRSRETGALARRQEAR